MDSQSESLLKKYSLPAAEIEDRSFEIVRSLLSPLRVTERELQVIVRIVHTCGDPEVAKLVRFHPRAVDAGIQAIRGGAPIFTDVRMGAAGVKADLARSFGCPVRCAIDVAPLAVNDGSGATRAALAMQSLGRELDGSIVAIGNAPTALLALLDMVSEGQAAPALIVGMPVGFVAAAESKRELALRDTPFITVQGTRGGSAMAAATVNALLLLARGAEGG